MVKINSLLATSAAVGAVLFAGAAQAAEPATSVSSMDQLQQYSQEGQVNSAAGQVTSVSQLSDVQPTDWAFQALQSLVERYGCIAGYPDRTYRGNRAMTRYEFAAGLNSCMDRVNELIAAATEDLATKEDLAVLQRLQEEFAAELATLRGRVDGLDAKVATLEEQQFSTTTKLAGEVIFALTDEFGSSIDNPTVFQDRVRLTLNTSFTGRDLLVTRLAAGNAQQFRSQVVDGVAVADPTTTQTFNFGNTGGNNVAVDWLAYYTDLGDKLFATGIQAYIPAFGGLHYDYAPTVNSMDTGDSGESTLSVFGQRNPIYDIGGGTGLGTTFSAYGLKVSAGYLAGGNDAATPVAGRGLFNGDNSILGQIAYAPENGPFGIAATYVSAYNTTGAIFGAGGAPGVTGTTFSNDINLLGNIGDPRTTVNAYGLSGTYQFNPQLAVNAWGMYANADEIGDGLEGNDVWSYGLSLGYSDLGKQGSLLGLVVGAQPYAPGARQGFDGVTLARAGQNTPLHVEAFYKYPLNDKISITPGLIWVSNATQIDTASDVWIGTLRTTFSF